MTGCGRVIAAQVSCRMLWDEKKRQVQLYYSHNQHRVLTTTVFVDHMKLHQVTLATNKQQNHENHMSQS